MKTYLVAPDGRSILCLRCGMRSYHFEDVRQLWCAKCNQFHVEPLRPIEPKPQPKPRQS